MIRDGAARALDWYVPRRRRAWERLTREAIERQEGTLHGLIHRARQTRFGRDHGFADVRTIADYQSRVPLREYLDFKPWFERSLAGHADVLWPGHTRDWVKTSGTMLILFERVARLGGATASSIGERWPNLGVFVHGGVSFAPYHDVFEQWIGRPLERVEVYPASEGFVALGTERTGGLSLMLDYDIFYEFVPFEDLGTDRPRRHTIADVELDRLYAIVLTTPAGLWSYVLGDVVRFTARKPLRLEIVGRTRHFVNAFGENVIVEEVERAIVEACRRTRAETVEFTVAPHYAAATESRGRHDWLVEFAVLPGPPLETFARVLDDTLAQLNTDYRTKRAGNVGMLGPRVFALPPGTFYAWMRSRGKLGGQNKVPRVTNDRVIADALFHTVDWHDDATVSRS